MMKLFSLKAHVSAIVASGMMVLLLTPQQIIASFLRPGPVSIASAFNIASTTMLIANSGPEVNDVTEMTRDGRVVWRLIGLESPVDAERLPSGNTLIAEAGKNRVIEVTPEGEIVWGVLVDSPYSARRLTNGNVLITSSATPSVVLEVTRDAEVVWSFDFTKSCESVGNQRFCRGVPRDAFRLSNNHTLVAFDDAAAGLIELDQDGLVVTEMKVTNEEGTGLRLYSVQELMTGNLLVTASGLTIARVVELSPTGESMWFYGPSGFCDECLYLPRDSVATASGTILIADYGKDRIVEVDAKGKIVWSYARPGAAPWSVREVLSEGDARTVERQARLR
jgi:hypothetical protein